ncbi:hypothetical protein [Haloarcula salinisoli]|uniref:Uncharacterized protein n=1 Tax=Haloarcula salinisoli TaxID=2487746 RepID=A0A8J7YBD2_9EURY|nr:hypothetical protein [Halomicroarcula salinisoli]MBX0302347.1 hypothetical protein [Halomicroarcula salinisoli]
MSADGSDEDEVVAESEPATVADIIEEAEPSATVDGERSEAGHEERSEAGDDEGAVAGSFAPDIEVTPQAPTPENTMFVALGVCLTILALADTIVGLSLVLVATVFAAVGLTAAVCYGVLVHTTPET